VFGFFCTFVFFGDGLYGLLTRQYVKREGITETLKGGDQIEWVRRMNNLYAAVEETVFKEYIMT